jgi:type I restriction enzyme S subunit
MRLRDRWNVCTLGDLLQIKHGYAFKGEHFADSGSHVVLTPGNFYETGGFKSKEHKEKYYKGYIPPEFILESGDLLLAMTEQSEGLLGSPLLVPKDDMYLHNQRLGLVEILGEDLLDKSFLYYLFNLHAVRAQIQASANGAKVRHTSPSRIYEVEVSLPPLPTQHKIASILSAYDDLIENNTRRIEILEEMAQAIYREWFVNFRFPGHEEVRLVDSLLGKIPEGWEVKKTTDAVAINPKTEVPKDGDKPFLPMGGLSNRSMLLEEIETRTGNSGSKFRNGDTLFARITPSLENGKTGYVQFLSSSDDTAFGSTEFIVLRSMTLSPEYVYLLARSDEFRDNAIKSMSGATGRQRVRESCFDNFLLPQPDPATIENFSDIASPMFRDIQLLARKNANLRRTRDLLLPRLISGEVDVSDVDIREELEAATVSP